MEALCTVTDLEKQLGGVPVLGPLSLSLYAGEIVGLIGANGTGKTTFLKLLAGVDRPTKGAICYAFPAVRVGYVPQDVALYESMTARQNLLFFADLAGLRGRARHARVDVLLDALHLKERAWQRVAHYSGGMKRRLNLAAAITVLPHVLLLDEPTVGADADSIAWMLALLQSLKAEGCCIVLVSHHDSEIKQTCDRIFRLENGSLHRCDA